jgi:hypothetical protein
MGNSATTLYAHWNSTLVRCYLGQNDSACSNGIKSSGGCTVRLTCPSGHSCPGMTTGDHIRTTSVSSLSCSGPNWKTGNTESYTRSLTIYKYNYFNFKNLRCNTPYDVVPGRYYTVGETCAAAANAYCTGRGGVASGASTECSSIETRYSFDKRNDYWSKA